MEVVIKTDPKELIDQHIARRHRAVFSQVVVNAYKWSDMILENNAIFKTLRGKKRLLPEIKNIAVEFFLMQAVKNKELPFQYRIGFNSNYSHPFLELFDTDNLIHINQVKSKHSCGRKAFCRDRHIMPIGSYFDFSGGEARFEIGDKLYFQLNHGYQSKAPSFVTLGIPNGLGKLDAALPLLEEFNSVEGFFPTSTITSIDDMSFEEFEQFAEGEVSTNEEKPSQAI